MKKKMNISLILFVLVLLAMLVTLVEMKNDIIVFSLPKRNEEISFHFNLITLNSIVVGFLFTNLGMILSLFSEELVKKIRKTSIIFKKNRVSVQGIMCCCVSIFISLIYVLQIRETLLLELYKVKHLEYFVYNVCILALIFGMVLFFKSIYETSKLLTNIYKYRSDYSASQIEDINKMLHKKNANGSEGVTEEDSFSSD